MKILLVAATDLELIPIKNELDELKDHEIFYLETGIGMTDTTYNLAKAFSDITYDLAINVGLAGAFDKELMLGEVVNVVEDQFSELGAEDGEKFLSLKDMGFSSSNNSAKLHSTYKLHDNRLKKLNGITVNTVHGNEHSIQKISERLKPAVESMEGAAFLYVCSMESIPSLQIRSISNYVEPRNREAWNIDLALKNLTKEVSDIINQLDAKA